MSTVAACRHVGEAATDGVLRVALSARVAWQRAGDDARAGGATRDAVQIATHLDARVAGWMSMATAAYARRPTGC